MIPNTSVSTVVVTETTTEFRMARRKLFCVLKTPG